jgi:hypothetical protein
MVCRMPQSGISGAILERESGLDVIVSTTVDFYIGVNDIVHRFCGGTGELNIPSGREGDTVLVQSAEELVLLLWEFACLRSVDGAPASIGQIELAPAVVAGDDAVGFVLRKRQPHDEASRDAQCAGLRDKKRVKIGAISLSQVTGIQRIASPPARAGLIIMNSRNDIIIENPGLVERVLKMPGDPLSLGGDSPVDGYQTICSQITRRLVLGGRRS